MAPVRDRSMIMVRTIRGMNILPTILSGVDRLRIAGPAAREVTGGHDGVCPMRKSPVAYSIVTCALGYDYKAIEKEAS